MFSETLQLMPLGAFVAACFVTLFAGFVKGAVGFAMPLVMISGLTLFLDPILALSGILLPIVLSNFLQVLRYSRAEIYAATIEYWRYILIISVIIVVVAQFVTRIPAQTFYLILGVPVVALSLIQLLGVKLTIPEHRQRSAEWIVGIFAGALGGMTGTWGPPTVLYLMALNTPKAKQFLVQGVVYGLGAVSLFAGHVQSGVLNPVTAPWSAALLIPAFVGMRIGFWFSDRMDADLFRKLTLLVLIVAGVNLVRRGIMG